MGTVRSPFRRQVQNPSAAAEAKLTNLRCKFKDSREVVKMIKGMKVERASQYLNNVILKKEAVTATKFKNGRGRHAQAKQFGSSDNLCFWPQKVAKQVLHLLQNAVNNAEQKGLNKDKLIISGIQANAARKIFKRTFGAHGRIKPFMKSPTHLHILLEEEQKTVPLPL